MTLSDITTIVEHHREELEKIENVAENIRSLYMTYANPEALAKPVPGEKPKHIPMVKYAQPLVKEMLQGYQKIKDKLTQEERKKFEKEIAFLTGIWLLMNKATQGFYSELARPYTTTAKEYEKDRGEITKLIGETIPAYKETTLWS